MTDLPRPRTRSPTENHLCPTDPVGPSHFMSDFSVKPVLTGEKTVLRPFTAADA